MRSAIRGVAITLIMLVLAGCHKNPGAMTKSEVESALKGTQLKLTDVSLGEKTESGYAGIGTSKDGTKYALTVTQDTNEKKLNWKAVSEKREVSGAIIRSY